MDELIRNRISKWFFPTECGARCIVLLLERCSHLVNEKLCSVADEIFYFLHSFMKHISIDVAFGFTLLPERPNFCLVLQGTQIPRQVAGKILHTTVFGSSVVFVGGVRGG